MRFRLTLTPLIIGFILLTIASCKKTLEEERTYNENKSIETYITRKGWSFNMVEGVYYVVHTPVYGYQVAKGDTVEFWYKGYTLDGKVFDTNIKSEAKEAKLDTLNRSFNSLITVAGRGNLVKGLDEGILYLHEGEQATILFSSSLGFGDNTFGPINPWSPLAYEVRLVRVNSSRILDETNYIESLNLTANGFLEDNSGLYFKYLLLGLNSKPSETDTIYGWYRGTLPDGAVFEDLGTGNQQIVLSDTDLPLGLRIGFTMTKKGGTTSLVIPSFLGYGNQGNKAILPYQTLFYQIRLDSIK